MTIEAHWKWNGARWWRFDFHSHTPKSDDYGKGAANQDELKQRSPREWLLDHMRAGLDCVAVTDHNSGAWIDELKRVLLDLDREQPVDYRPLTLFPGVELSINGGIHVLAIFGPEKTTSDIDSLRGAAGFRGTKGKSDGVTTKAYSEVVEAIIRADGIAIPAHVDERNGLFEIQGTTLKQALDNSHIYAMEMVDPTYAKPQAYQSAKLNWAEVAGSDSHHPTGNPEQNFPGSRFTWIKMGTPSIDGLRLALLDGSLSVKRSDMEHGDPNQHAEKVIESIEIDQARYLGRPGAFTVGLNPWMSAVIGGRGTGKSTLVEFLRLAMRREDELPEALQGDFEKYRQVYTDRVESGLLTADAAIRVVYRKNGATYRIQWDVNGTLDPIQECTDAGWVSSEGDIRQRFPVRMYSQKQIFQLAKTPLALLAVINEAPDVDYTEWKKRLTVEENQYLSLRAKIREIDAGMSEKSRLKGELDDVKRKLAVFEQSGHADTLKTLQLRRRQLQAVEGWESGLCEIGRQLRDLSENVSPESFDASVFDQSKPEEMDFMQLIQATHDSIQGIAKQVMALAQQADQVVSDWRSRKDASAWKAAVDQANQAYASLMERLKNEGVSDPAGYGVLVQKRQSIEKQIAELDSRRAQSAKLNEQSVACLDRIKDLRRTITQRRQRFLATILEGNAYVRIAVTPYGATEPVESEFRGLIQRDAGVSEKDIGSPGKEGLLGELYAGNPAPEEIETRLAHLKRKVRAIAGNPQQAEVADKRFGTHLAKLQPEVLDRLDLWFPEDSLDVEYSTSSDRNRFRPIQEGSPGQKTAALLAFLLTYGDEPLILDQPEDDLDNHLIYDLIVTQLREVKRRRQVIVVTHNANIVVNGDAELVQALAARGGQTQREAAGCLQDRAVRRTICEVMEGGEKAFEQRYRRIALEGRHV